jgi:hypothetical protein
MKVYVAEKKEISKFHARKPQSKTPQTTMSGIEHSINR